jgi:hypothetical protein
MENNNTRNLPEGLGLRIRDTILKILEIPVKEGKKVNATLRNDAGKVEAVIKIDLRDMKIDIHNYIHNHFIRSDAINNDTNTRDLHYRIPDRYLEDVKHLHGLITSSESNTPYDNTTHIKKVLDTIDSKATKKDSDSPKLEEDKKPVKGQAAAAKATPITTEATPAAEKTEKTATTTTAAGGAKPKSPASTEVKTAGGGTTAKQ